MSINPTLPYPVFCKYEKILDWLDWGEGKKISKTVSSTSTGFLKMKMIDEESRNNVILAILHIFGHMINIVKNRCFGVGVTFVYYFLC